MFHERTQNAAKGKWKGILMALGVPEAALKDKHGPCPMCGGENRFRWDNKDGKGTYICNQCGAGDGMKLAIGFTGQPFPEVAARIDELLGNVKPDTVQPRQEMTEAERLQALRGVWSETRPISQGDLAHTYLTSRCVGELIYPKALRFGVIRDGEGGIRPCMVAMVSDAAGKAVSMHRTFLRPDGLAKAEMTSPRKLMPGALPDGACVRLSDFMSGTLGIAEGIETAMSASALYGIPVWAAINAAMLGKWMPPDGCDEVAVFGDNDANFAGQAAAYGLANRLAIKKIPVTVHIPTMPGMDWNDAHVLKVKQ